MARKGKQLSKVQPNSSSPGWKKHRVQDSNMSVTKENAVQQYMSEHQQRQCMLLLRKLMRHKYGWVFNEPVDAEKLELHDYHSIIKTPMDLGTVKDRIMSNHYASPSDFAADVRLTFNNALLYNPKTDDVHAMALTLCALFEELWQGVAEKLAIVGGDDAVINRIDSSLIDKVAKRSDVASVDVGKKAVTQSRPVKRLRISFASNLQHNHKSVRELTVAEKVWLVDTLEKAPDDVQVAVTRIILEHYPVVDGDEVDIMHLDKVTLWRVYKVVRDHRGVSSSATSSARELIASENTANEVELKDVARDSRSEMHRGFVEKKLNSSASLRDDAGSDSGSSSTPSGSRPRSRSRSRSPSTSSGSDSSSSSTSSGSDSSSSSEESSSSYKKEEE